MNKSQLEHFRNILLNWKNNLISGVSKTVHYMQDEASNFPDPNDRATQESEFGLELRTRDRERKLLRKYTQRLRGFLMDPMVIVRILEKRSALEGLKLARLPRYALRLKSVENILKDNLKILTTDIDKN